MLDNIKEIDELILTLIKEIKKLQLLKEKVMNENIKEYNFSNYQVENKNLYQSIEIFEILNGC